MRPRAKGFTSFIIIQAASNCAVAQEGSDLLGLGPVEENQVLSTDIFEVHLGGVELLGQVEDRVLHEAAALSPVLEFNVHFDGKAFTIIGLQEGEEVVVRDLILRLLTKQIQPFEVILLAPWRRPT